MPEFVSAPRLKEGVVPSSPRDLATKEYVDAHVPTISGADGGGVGPAVRFHVSVDAGSIA